MHEETVLRSMEQILRRAQELIARVQEENERFPGFPALDEDIAKARMLIQEIDHDLSESLAALSPHLDKPADADLEGTAIQAFNKAYNLVSRLYDDLRQIHAALIEGRSQEYAIKHAAIHLRRLTLHCRRAREQLREVARAAATE